MAPSVQLTLGVLCMSCVLCAYLMPSWAFLVSPVLIILLLTICVICLRFAICDLRFDLILSHSSSPLLSSSSCQCGAFPLRLSVPYALGGRQEAEERQKEEPASSSLLSFSHCLICYSLPNTFFSHCITPYPCAGDLSCLHRFSPSALHASRLGLHYSYFSPATFG